MKTKLLKKVRKRFIIHFSPVGINVFDLKESEIKWCEHSWQLIFIIANRLVGYKRAMSYLNKQKRLIFNQIISK